VPDEEIAEFKVQMTNQSINPMVIKKRLAQEIVTQFHGAPVAREAEQYFTKVFQKRELPASIKLQATVKVEVERNIPRLLLDAGLVKSLSEARRLLAHGAVEVNGTKVSSNLVKLEDEDVIKVGKRGFLKIIDSTKRKFEVGNS